MVFLIGGETHTGKTLLAQKLLEMHHFPYMSLDHLKMGFINGIKPIPFNVGEDAKIADFMFDIIAGILNVCLENAQNLIIEGVYLPPSKTRIFLNNPHIRILYLLFSEKYILQNYTLIFEKENIIEKRLITERTSQEELVRNHTNLKQECLRYRLPFLEIQENYENEIAKAYEVFAIGL